MVSVRNYYWMLSERGVRKFYRGQGGESAPSPFIPPCFNYRVRNLVRKNDRYSSLEALRDGLALLNKAMTLGGSGEKESCLYSLYDGRAALLLALAEMDESYTPAAMRALDTIHEKKLMDKGLITTESVVDALEIRLAENNFST